ncbi:MAG: carbohydrate ABC transporter permease [Phycisphaerales bacterium]
MGAEKRSMSAWGFILFPLAIITVFNALPTISGIGLSFFEWSGGAEPRFIGLRNFVEGWNDATLRHAMRNTLIFALVTTPLIVVLAFLFAVAVNAPWFIARTTTRTIFFLPTIVSIVAIGFIWRWVLDPGGGLLNHLLVDLGVPRDSIPSWLGDSPVGLATIMAVSVWRQLGFALVLYLAALSDVPRSLYDAGAVDGASAWQTMWRITWPSVRPMTFFLLITGMITALQVFDIVLIMIGRVEQEWTDVLNLYLYREFMSNRLGYAATIGVVVLVLTLIVTAGQAWWWRRFEGAEA